MASSENDALSRKLQEDIRRWEGQDLEFIRELPDQVRELRKEIAAFATSNAGTVYLGVNNDGSIVGVAGIASLDDIQGKDNYGRRIQGISQGVDPPLRVAVTFIGTEGRIVVRIDVPKGLEPVYYCDGVPYLRDIATSRPAKAIEVKEIHQRFFQATIPAPPDPEQVFLRHLIEQFSDVQLLLYDYRDHLVRPDITQMLYDLGASGRILFNMSSEPTSKKLGIEEQLVRTSEMLEELESHTFYIGSQSVDEFGDKAKFCLSAVAMLSTQIRKRARKQSLTEYKELINNNIESLQKEWQRRERYFERGELQTLRENFRRYGFVFFRFGNYPEADDFTYLGPNLRSLGEKLRNLSSVQKYFSYGLGMKPLTEIEARFSECSKIMKTIMGETGN